MLQMNSGVILFDDNHADNGDNADDMVEPKPFIRDIGNWPQVEATLGNNRTVWHVEEISGIRPPLPCLLKR